MSKPAKGAMADAPLLARDLDAAQAQRLIDAAGDIEVVLAPIVGWLHFHATDAETQFVYKAWLDAGGGVEVVRESIVGWLAVHAE